MAEFFVREKPFVNMRGIHFDLKGLPPTPQRMIELLNLAAESKLNCILVEWEDMYPWMTYPELRNETAYSINTVKQFLKRAQELNIEIIPLVQSFGHMENVLSKKRFKHLREIPDNVSDLCPSKEESKKVVLQMVQDVLYTHDNLKYFHLGGDEVWSFGSCPACKKVIAKSGKAELYLSHLQPILEFLKSRNIRPILWDDMMRHWSESEIKKISDYADLMCWSYSANPFNRHLTEEMVEKFVKCGCHLWAASAYKGASNAYADVPDIQGRQDNMLAWVKYARKMKMKGVVTTGWSRFNTFVSPCESTEVSLDTFVLAGKIAWDGEIPADRDEWVKNFLEHCEKNGIKTSHFFECRKNAEDLQQLRNSAFILARNFLQQTYISGEPDRVNYFRVKESIKGIKETLKKLKDTAKLWEKCHRGLIPSVWLKKYVFSRVKPVEKLFNCILKTR